MTDIFFKAQSVTHQQTSCTSRRTLLAFQRAISQFTIQEHEHKNERFT